METITAPKPEPTPVLLLLSNQVLQMITEAKVIIATRASATTPDAVQILWQADAPQRLAAMLRPLLEGYIKAAAQDPNILEETVLMMAVGQERHDEASTIMARAIGAAMLLAFGIHPTYGDALELAMANAGEILTGAQRRTMDDLEDRGYERRPLVRYGVMQKAGDGEHPPTIIHVHPDGHFNAA